MTGLKRRPLLLAIACFAVAAGLSAGLSACGKKSALVPPEESNYPRQYPRQ